MITSVKDKLNKDVTYSNCKLCTENVSYKAFIKLFLWIKWRTRGGNDGDSIKVEFLR